MVKEKLFVNQNYQINIEDLGGSSYLELELYILPEIPGNKHLQILDIKISHLLDEEYLQNLNEQVARMSEFRSLQTLR